MYRREHRHQLSLEDYFLPFGGKLSGDNRWIKLADLIPWEVRWTGFLDRPHR
jgi:IS5 family transposase